MAHFTPVHTATTCTVYTRWFFVLILVVLCSRRINRLLCIPILLFILASRNWHANDVCYEWCNCNFRLLTQYFVYRLDAFFRRIACEYDYGPTQPNALIECAATLFRAIINAWLKVTRFNHFDWIGSALIMHQWGRTDCWHYQHDIYLHLNVFAVKITNKYIIAIKWI